MGIEAEFAGTSLAAFIDMYLFSVKGQLRSWASVNRRLRCIAEFFPGWQLVELTRRDVSRYIRSRLDAGLANGSVNVEISSLSAAYGYASKHWGWAIHNPVLGLYLRQPQGRLRYLTPDEIRAVLRAASGPKRSPHLADFIRLAVNTGARKNELLKLRWKSVELGAKRITVESDISKNGRRRSIPLNEGGLAAIRSRLAFRDCVCPESPWVFCYSDGRRVGRIDKPFWGALKRAGIEDFRIHDLRHTFASWLVTEEISLYHVKALLGHSSITMTERYAHLATAALHRSVAVLDGL